MIPVKEQPEPENFEKFVRQPGKKFLEEVPNPTKKQWDYHSYWTKYLIQMRAAYKAICAYSAHWISPDTGAATIDHFISKSKQPSLAYDWSNYRYTASRYNSRKLTKSILDPFHLEANWFLLDFPSLQIKPNAELLPEQRQSVNDTIEVLKLNEEISLEARQIWVMDYCEEKILFEYLEEKAPFIAYELKRQDLIYLIKKMMRKPIL